MDSHPPARRPHKSPAHTVKDHGIRPQRLDSALRCFTVGSRTSCHGLLVLSTPREGFRPSPQVPPEGVSSKGAAHSSPFLRSVNTLFQGHSGPARAPRALPPASPVEAGRVFCTLAGSLHRPVATGALTLHVGCRMLPAIPPAEPQHAVLS